MLNKICIVMFKMILYLIFFIQFYRCNNDVNHISSIKIVTTPDFMHSKICLNSSNSKLSLISTEYNYKDCSIFNAYTDINPDTNHINRSCVFEITSINGIQNLGCNYFNDTNKFNNDCLGLPIFDEQFICNNLITVRADSVYFGDTLYSAFHLFYSLDLDSDGFNEKLIMKGKVDYLPFNYPKKGILDSNYVVFNGGVLELYEYNEKTYEEDLINSQKLNVITDNIDPDLILRKKDIPNTGSIVIIPSYSETRSNLCGNNKWIAFNIIFIDC